IKETLDCIQGLTIKLSRPDGVAPLLFAERINLIESLCSVMQSFKPALKGESEITHLRNLKKIDFTDIEQLAALIRTANEHHSFSYFFDRCLNILANYDQHSDFFNVLKIVPAGKAINQF